MKKVLAVILFASSLCFGQVASSTPGSGAGMNPVTTCIPWAPPLISICPKTDGLHISTDGINFGAALGPGGVGPQGPIGPAGTNGTPGINGTNGAQGVAGPVGPKGADGAPGATGPQGPQGVAGVAGTGFGPGNTTCTVVSFDGPTAKLVIHCP